ncbi:hypothetical protein Skr01_57320 [Sphaerisporangium krabiense]|uniref:Uncharacterized protein n=1 Tax=Sphaerisporangium krabiense TaxID=763782 RepID=A0A7W8Z8L6_9ACTN|nr:hypothetical protein [Sphaerisporangium krabiense]GII65647.1 hypothetical protein Skr01_57320 [Sphaerisporangium krabiense]
MATYQVQVTETYRPSATYPHDTTRSVTAVKSGPCLAPVLVHLARRHRRIACGGRLPSERQCPACASVIVITHTEKITAHEGSNVR